MMHISSNIPIRSTEEVFKVTCISESTCTFMYAQKGKQSHHKYPLSNHSKCFNLYEQLIHFGVGLGIRVKGGRERRRIFFNF